MSFPPWPFNKQKMLWLGGEGEGEDIGGIEGINSLASYLVLTYIYIYITSIASYGVVWYAKVWHLAPTE